MKCYDKETLLKYLTNDLENNEINTIKSHIEQCNKCQNELIILQAILEAGDHKEISKGNCLSDEQISSYIDKTLSNKEISGIEKHLSSCDKCLNEVLEIKQILKEAPKEKITVPDWLLEKGLNIQKESSSNVIQNILSSLISKQSLRYGLSAAILVLVLFTGKRLFFTAKYTRYNSKILVAMMHKDSKLLSTSTIHKGLLSPKKEKKEIHIQRIGYFINYYYGITVADGFIINKLNKEVLNSLDTLQLISISDKIRKFINRDLIDGDNVLQYKFIKETEDSIQKELATDERQYYSIGKTLWKINYSINNPKYKIPEKELKNIQTDNIAIKKILNDYKNVNIIDKKKLSVEIFEYFNKSVE